MIDKTRICQIEGFPLIKIKSRELIEKLQSGSFYMNSLKFFRNTYKDGKSDGVGDPYEGKLFVHNAVVKIAELGVEKVLNDYPISTVNENDFVFCMFGVDASKHTSFTFTEEQKEKLIAFDEAALLITNTDEFFRRIEKAADEKGLQIISGFVKYYDETADEILRFISLLTYGTENIVFHKTVKYSYQQEYRFTIQNNTGEDFIELDIGDITDISKIFTTKEILNSTIVRG